MANGISESQVDAILKTLLSTAERYLKDGDRLNAYVTASIGEGLSSMMLVCLQTSARGVSRGIGTKFERIVKQAEAGGIGATGARGANLSGAPQQQQEGEGGITCADFPPYTLNPEKDSFDSLAGLENEKLEVRRAFVYPFLFPYLFDRTRAILFWGPPGTGKTLLARAAANEINKQLRDPTAAALYILNGANLKGKYVGETEKRISTAFRCGEERSASGTDEKPRISVFFIDEIDALAASRDSSEGSEVNATNALISKMDGAESYDNVVVIGATNRPWVIDSALQRRFTRQIFMDLPGDAARSAAIRKQLIHFFSRGGGTAGRAAAAALFEGPGMTFLLAQVVALTGPSEKALTYLKPAFFRASGRAVRAAAASTFGYSFSDLSKVVTLAINQMGIRHLQQPVCLAKSGDEISICGGDDGGGDQCRGGRCCYLTCDLPGSDEPACGEPADRCTAQGDVVCICDLSRKQRASMRTRDITGEDFSLAIEAYPSSIDTAEYVRLVARLDDSFLEEGGRELLQQEQRRAR